MTHDGWFTCSSKTSFTPSNSFSYLSRLRFRSQPIESHSHTYECNWSMNNIDRVRQVKSQLSFMRSYLAVNSSKVSSPCGSADDLFRVVLKPLMLPTTGAPPNKGSRRGMSCARRKPEDCVRDARRTRLKDDIESVEHCKRWDKQLYLWVDEVLGTAALPTIVSLCIKVKTPPRSMIVIFKCAKPNLGFDSCALNCQLFASCTNNLSWSLGSLACWEWANNFGLKFQKTIPWFGDSSSKIVIWVSSRVKQNLSKQSV